MRQGNWLIVCFSLDVPFSNYGYVKEGKAAYL